ncbi:PilY2 family type 4a fimbrial biogenesis protein [Stutzerimonas stutzeri]|uniref:PilY2 family type 4a fimbrial biogenesis protein n=1 Tax=Stutzerimonas TaxID=2901164 RepID=UPI001BB02D4B|nr:PilY2 family type 4a fimbrial biogenesis protein [Stutzerimonas stutzeri]QUE76697.1 PilY2 family type 4a fimbrial biogenesis protein [Stutzerimonas stutzeri]
MNTRLHIPLAAISLILLSGLANAATFEAVGTIDEVRLGENLVVVEQTTYALPNNTVINGTPAILQLKPGYLISFSGTEASPRSIIESVYLYPDSVRRVEQGEQP